MSTITIDGNDIQAGNINGLTYKGFGVLSANSTSDLLLDYKAQQPQAYAAMMQYLFGGEYPIMTHVKLEMGNDRNNSTGAEAATKRTAAEKTNILRNPGWQIAADAKKINPNLKISILRWREPDWVKTDEDIYIWYKEAILQAYETYGYMVDYINPNVNERWSVTDDVQRTKLFRKWIDGETKDTIPNDTERALYQKIKLIVSDEVSTVSASVAEKLKSDSEFFNAVDVVGYHYSPHDDNNDGMKWFAEKEDKEVWISEGQATFSNSAFRPSNNVKDPSVAGTGIGGTGSALEMANTFIKGFTESRRTHVIYQPAIASFYDDGQYSSKELVNAKDPWSGWMHYDAGLLLLAHISKFAKTGWENETNTAGIWRVLTSASHSDAVGTNPVNGRNGGDNYMTLCAPDKSDFSTMIVNDSEYEKTFEIQMKNMNLKSDAKLELWETRAADKGAFNENYMKCLGDVAASGGSYTIHVKPYSAVTVTSLEQKDNRELTEGLPVEGERPVLDTDSTGSVQDVDNDILYADTFDYTGKTVPVLDGKGGFTGEMEDYIASRGGGTGAIARYTNVINGAFEAYKTDTGKYVLRQQLDKKATGTGSAWNDGDPVVVIGDMRWTNYAASIDVLFEKDSGVAKPYASIAIRQTGSSHHLTASAGYTLEVKSDGSWKLYRINEVVKSGTMAEAEGFHSGKNQWNNLKLYGAGNIIRAYINEKQIAEFRDSHPVTAGRIGLGSSFSYTQFANLKVTKIDGEVPYFSELLDNLETYDLTGEKNPKLVYNNKWNHRYGQGMYVYHRTISTSTDKGATLKYNFTGTGLEIFAGTGITAKIKVTVDGKIISSKAQTQSADNMNAIYYLHGLPYGEHSVQLEVVSGSLCVDMVGILGNYYGNGTGKEIESFSGTAVGGETEDNTETKSVYKKDGGVYKVTGKKKVTYQKPSVKSVKKVKIPDKVILKVDGTKKTYKVTAVAAGACSKCEKLTNVIIGKNIKKIGKNAFAGCKSVKQITIKSQKLTGKSVGSNAFKGISKKAVIKVPKKQMNTYKKWLKKAGVAKEAKIK